MKRICAITMARNDAFFLEKWISYYGQQLGEENLYIFLDGKDQEPPKNAGKVNVTLCDKIPGNVRELDLQKANFLSQTASKLLEKYDIVIGCDADEFLIVDPILNISLKEYLSSIKIKNTISGLGLDVIQHIEKESTYMEGDLLLKDREYAILEPDYTKPIVINKSVTWGVGNHRIRGCNYHIDPNLFLFHFGSFDVERINKKIQTANKNLSPGWAEHIKNRRLRPINIVAQCKEIVDGDQIFGKARFVQTYFRAPYKWNRPTMLRKEIVIRIPKRFKNLV